MRQPGFSHRERLLLHTLDTRTVYPDDSRDNNGGRITGFFIPPMPGDWVFYPAASLRTATTAS